uniref:protein-synthesizing GTPase n=1 Tax=Syphacia muris TaxID=451379 RepID=A0A0N5AA00_9BILA
MLLRSVLRKNYLTNFRFVLYEFSSRCFAASKSTITLSKPNLNVGTIGHIDHGKTTLTAAITRVLAEKGQAKFFKFDDIDKAKEEKKRGITINIAHLSYESDKRRYSHTDCPGHSDYIKNTICGTAQMDTAILVVAAPEGVMEQTKEHLLLAKQVGVSHIIVFINKTDLVDDDIVTLAEIEALELLEQYGYKVICVFGDAVTVVKGSALAALEGKEKKCIEELINALDEVPLPPRKEDLPFLMPITSKIVVPGRGTVFIGTVEEGVLKKGEKVDVLGGRKALPVVVNDIQIFGKSVNEVKAGDHCGILCKGANVSSAHRGYWICASSTGQTSNCCEVELYLLSEEENGRRTGIRSGYTDIVFCTTWDKPGRFIFDREMLMPGEYCISQLVFENPVPIKNSLLFAVREGRKNTVGRGVIRKILPSLSIGSFHDLKSREEQ